MLYWPKPVSERDAFPAPRLEYLSETARFRRSRRTADQARGCDCGLPVDDGFAIGGVGDHRHEGAAVRIFGDEHRVPCLALRAEHLCLHRSAPDAPTAQPLKDRTAVAAIVRLDIGEIGSASCRGRVWQDV